MIRRQSHQWSDEERKAFLVLYEAGMTCPEVSQKLGIPLFAVESHKDYLRRSGQVAARLKRWGADIDRTITLWAEGKSVEEIAASLHRSREQIRNRLRQDGYKENIGTEDRIFRDKLKASNARFVAALLKHHADLEIRI